VLKMAAPFISCLNAILMFVWYSLFSANLTIIIYDDEGSLPEKGALSEQEI
jgi:hypothetical protein